MKFFIPIILLAFSLVFVPVVLAQSEAVSPPLESAQDEGWVDGEEEGWGEDENEGWGEEEGWEEAEPDVEESPDTQEDQRPSFVLPKPNLPFNGFLRQRVGHHLEHKAGLEGFTTLQLALEIEYDKRFAQDFRFHFVGQGYHDFVYALEGRENYSSEELDEFETGGELKELWLSFKQEKFDIYLGRQVVVWGEADGFPVTDVINPRDMTLFYYQSLEDSRLSLAMARVNYYWGANTLTLLGIGEFRPNRLPIEGSEFDFRPAITGQFAQIPFPVQLGDHEDIEIMSDPEWGIRLMMPREGYDVSIMAASVFDDDFVLAPTETGVLEMAHPRYNMYGFTANKLWDAFIFKIEAAYYQNKSFNAPYLGDPRLITPGNFLQIEERDVVNVALGFDYTFSDEFTIMVNQLYKQVLDYDPHLLIEHETNVTFIHCAFSFRNDTLNPSYTMYYFHEDDDIIHKLKLEYETVMGLVLSGGLDIVQPSHSYSQFGLYKYTSRAWAEVKYSF